MLNRLHKTGVIVITIVILFILVSCENIVTIGHDDIQQYLLVAQNTLINGNSIFEDYIIDEEKGDLSWTVQFIDGQGEYLEESKSLVKYFRENELTIIENGVRRTSPDFSFSGYESEAKFILDKIAILVHKYNSAQFRGQKWEGIVSGREAISCDVNIEDIAMLNLSPDFNQGNLFIQFDDRVLKYVRLEMTSSDNSYRKELIIGKLDFEYLLDFPD